MYKRTVIISNGFLRYDVDFMYIYLFMVVTSERLYEINAHITHLRTTHIVLLILTVVC